MNSIFSFAKKHWVILAVVVGFLYLSKKGSTILPLAVGQGAADGSGLI